MNKRIMNKTMTCSLLAGALFAGNALAAPINQSFDSFGTLAAATFGGTGIPNDAVAVAVTNVGGVGSPQVTLGLTAHQRYSNPALTNDGAGTFFANPGVDTHAPSSAADPYAIWNVGFYIGGTDQDAYSYKLFYDFDRGSNTDENDHGQFSFPGGSGTIQDSWNLGMNFLGVSLPGLIDPGLGTFDPNNVGEYSFALVAFDAQGVEVDRSAIVVQVGQVPEPGTLALLGLGLAGLAGMRRRKI